MTPLWREQAVHAIDVALAEAIYSLAVLPALIQRQTDVPASPTKLLGGADQFNRRWAEQYTAAATSLFGDSDQFSGFLWKTMARLVPAAELEADYADLVGTMVQFLNALPQVLRRDCELAPAQLDRVQQACDEARVALLSRLDEREVLTAGETGDELEDH